DGPARSCATDSGSSSGSRRRLTVLVVAGSKRRLHAGLDASILETLDGRVDLGLDVGRDHARAIVERRAPHRLGGDVEAARRALVLLVLHPLDGVRDGLLELLLGAHYGALGGVWGRDELVNVDADGVDVVLAG